MDSGNRRNKQAVGGPSSSVTVSGNRIKKQAIEEDSDMISELPVPILHHILCFLSQKEAVQTWVLSKSWHNIGSTRPKFDFRQSDFRWDWRGFIRFMDKTINTCLIQNLSVQEFRLEISQPHILEWDLERSEEYNDAGMSVWLLIISALHHLNVKSFNFSFICTPHVVLPRFFFTAESLEKLSLRNCSLSRDEVEDVDPKNLKSLSLDGVCIEDETLQLLLSTWHSVQNLVIVQCHSLNNIVLSDSCNLKHFHYNDRSVPRSIEISTQTIETLKINGRSTWFYHHNHDDDGNHLFPLLRSLYLNNVLLFSESFESISSHFPVIEEISLVQCYAYEEHQLSSQSTKQLRNVGMNMFGRAAIDDGNHFFSLLESLYINEVWLSSESLDCLSTRFPSIKKVSLINCFGLEEYQLSSRSIKQLRIELTNKPNKVAITIDAPNLVEFEYEGGIQKSISFEETPVKLKSKVVVRSDADFKYDASSLCLELYECFKGLAGSQILLDIVIRHVRQNKKHVQVCPPSLVAAEETREPIVVECLTMTLTGYLSTFSSAFINNMLCFWHPRNMNQWMYIIPRDILANEHNHIIEYLQKVLLSKREMRQCYLWKQDLEEASMERVFEDEERDKVRFRLKWKEW